MASIGARAVGVDFGTSTSLVAEKDGAATAEVLPLGRQTRFVPSVAAWSHGQVVVGEDAEVPGGAVIRSIKRAITEHRTSVTVETTDGIRDVPVDEVVLALLTEVAVRARDRDLPLDEEPVVRLGCPAMWTGEQRRRLLDLARKAGIPVSHATLVDEPVAAGVAWLTHRFLADREAPKGRVLVFDMGGGTLDLAVLEVEGGEKPDVRVLAAVGLPEAGDDLDRAITKDFEAGLTRQGFTIADSPHRAALHDELLQYARSTKVALSAHENPEWSTPLRAASFGGISTIRYTREQLEKTFAPQMARAEQMVWAALRAARLTEEFAPARAEIHPTAPDELRRLVPDELGRDVRYVVLAGGMSRIPMVARRLGEMLPKAELHERVGGFLSDEVVVAGLADTIGYDKISLHRPAFDFVLEWDGGRERRVLYEAYTPLYDPVQIARGNTFLGHGWHARYPDVAREGHGVLRIFSPTGEPVGLEIEGQPMDGIRIAFGSHPFSFKIYCGGQILISDGSGRQYSVRVDRWPVVRGHDFAAKLELMRVPEVPDPPVAWYHRDRDADRPWG